MKKYVLFFSLSLCLGCPPGRVIESDVGEDIDFGSQDVQEGDDAKSCTLKGAGEGCQCVTGYHEENKECIKDKGTIDPCEGVTCSDKGNCTIKAGVATCECEDGFVPSTTSCIADDSSCTFFISPTGEDSNVGSKDKPFKTLEGARDSIRKLKKGDRPKDGVHVCLQEGIYHRVTSFSLTQEDSGEEGKPVTYRSLRGEQARISGAISLPADKFSEVKSDSLPAVFDRIDDAAKGKLLQIDLSKITTDYGKLVSRGGTKSWGDVGALELFVDGERMELSRWPDKSAEFPYLFTKNTDSSKRLFSYEGKRPERWKKAEEIWLHGMWYYFFSDKHVKITNIDYGSKKITFGSPTSPYYGLRDKRPYYFENILEEITEPGEWYLNRSTGMLYMWPKKTLGKQSEIMVSISEKPLVLLDGASHIRFENLSFEMSRAVLLQTKKSEHIKIERSRFRFTGIDGVVLDGTDVGLEGCEVYEVGNFGIIITGGDRKKLISSENYVKNSHVHHNGYWSHSAGGFRIEKAVGVTLSHNHIHHSNYNIIAFAGNNHIIEYNNIHHTNQWSGDGGAIYTGRRWDWLGSKIRYNFIHDIKTGFVEDHGVHGIYIDDSSAGVEIFGNIIHNVSGRAINARGGRNTLVRNNVLTKNGIGYSGDMAGILNVGPDGSDKLQVFKNLIAMPYQQDPWKSSYPEAAKIPNKWEDIRGTNFNRNGAHSHWLYPEGTYVQYNIGFGNKVWMREGDYDGTGVFNKYADLSDNLESVENIYVDADGGDFSLRKDSAAFKLKEFKDIPFKKIGIQP